MNIEDQWIEGKNRPYSLARHLELALLTGDMEDVHPFLRPHIAPAARATPHPKSNKLRPWPGSLWNNCSTTRSSGRWLAAVNRGPGSLPVGQRNKGLRADCYLPGPCR